MIAGYPGKPVTLPTTTKVKGRSELLPLLSPVWTASPAVANVLITGLSRVLPSADRTCVAEAAPIAAKAAANVTV
jgi:hypothetical protein